MARDVSPRILALLDGDSLVQCEFIVISLPGGSPAAPKVTKGFWSGVSDIRFPNYRSDVAFNGAFYGSGGRVEVSAVTRAVTGDVRTLTVTLSGRASYVLTTVGFYSLSGAEVDVARALYDPDTLDLMEVPVFMGQVDRSKTRGSGDEATLVLECASRSRELDLATNRKRTHADQLVMGR